MYRYKITLEYNGSRFSGWQRQANSLSVQEVLESAVKSFSGETVSILGSGRTDAGVHALGQVAHFDLKRSYKPEVILSALNHFLKDIDISVREAAIVDSEFHARFSAVCRTYCYLIAPQPFPVALFKNKVWYIKEDLNVILMEQAAQFLIGKHDFTSFCSASCQSKSKIKTMNLIKVERVIDSTLFYPLNLIRIRLQARSFLHNQVRIIVGTLKSAGLTKIAPEHIKEILTAKDRQKAHYTAPACGLYLEHIEYEV